MIEEKKNRAGCLKTKIGFRQNATCSGMRKREAPEVACGKEKCRVFGQPGGYAGVDIFKFYMSILVVLRHVVQNWCAPDSLLFMVVTNGLSTVAVPFFFITTGYLFFERKDDSAHLRKQIGRLLILYLVWSLIYSPIRLLPVLLKGRMTASYIVSFIQDILFSGTYYHLWYIPAAAVALLIVFLLRKALNKKMVLMVAGILFLVGILDDSYRGIISPAFFQSYNAIFLTTRNGFFCGTVFVALGSYIKSVVLTKKQRHEYIFVAGISSFLLILESILNYKILGSHVNNMMFMTIPLAIVLFKLSLQIQSKTDTKELRYLSELVYFVHPVVLVGVGRFLPANAAWIKGMFTIVVSIGSAWCLLSIIKKKNSLRIMI